MYVLHLEVCILYLEVFFSRRCALLGGVPHLEVLEVSFIWRCPLSGSGGILIWCHLEVSFN